MATFNDNDKPGYAFSFDGGNHWEDSTLAGHKDPSCAFDRHDNAYFCHLKSGNPCSVFVSRTQNKNGKEYGKNWEHFWVDSLCDKPYIAVDNTGGDYDGRVYVTADYEGGGMGLSYATHQGSLWFGPKKLNPEIESGGVTGGSVPAVDDSGNVYVAYLRIDGPYSGDTGQIMVCKSRDGGENFSDPDTACYLTAKVFTQTEMWGCLNISSIPTIAIDDSGYVYLAYTELYGTVDSADYKVKYVWSSGKDDWKDWSEPAIATGDTTNWQFHPWLAADPSGGIYLVYRDTGDDKDLVDVYLAESSGHGSGFDTPNTKVTSVNSDPDVGTNTEYMGVAASAGYVHPPWGDFRHATAQDTNVDVYAALVAIDQVKGDIDCNADVDTIDANLCVDIILEVMDPTDYQFSGPLIVLKTL